MKVKTIDFLGLFDYGFFLHWLVFTWCTQKNECLHERLSAYSSIANKVYLCWVQGSSNFRNLEVQRSQPILQSLNSTDLSDLREHTDITDDVMNSAELKIGTEIGVSHYDNCDCSQLRLDLYV